MTNPRKPLCCSQGFAIATETVFDQVCSECHAGLHFLGNRALGGARFHQFLVEKNIPHRYVFEPRRRHSWESGWMPEAVAFLFSDR